MFLNPTLSDTLTTATHSVAAAGEHAAAEGGGHAFSFPALLDHIKDGPALDGFFGEIHLPKLFEGIVTSEIHLPKFLGGIVIPGISLEVQPTKHMVFVTLAAIILAIIAISAARQNKKNKVPKGLGNLIEVVVVFLKDEVVLPNMGTAGLKYLPYIITMFFFILTMNLVGLIPFGAPATANINVTAALALTAFIMIQVGAIRSQGFVKYLSHLTGGVHWILWPIMIPIEILGLFTKPFALCMRLFANIRGGKTVFLSLIGLIMLFGSWAVAPLPAIFAVGIFMLEIFVAFLQSYVFVMLTSLFMGIGMHAEHGSEH